MTAYEDVNNCEDFGMQAGTHIPISFAYFYPNGNPIPLVFADSIGCTLSLVYDDEVPLVDIKGEVNNSDEDGNVMKVDILSQYTNELSNCVLYYRPYVVIGGNTYRSQGRIFVGSTTPYN